MYKLSLSLLCLAAACAAPGDTPDIDDAAIINGRPSNLPFIVKLMTSRGQCSGVMINATTIYTAAHCGSAHTVRWSDGRIYEERDVEDAIVYRPRVGANDFASVRLRMPMRSVRRFGVPAPFPGRVNAFVAGMRNGDYDSEIPLESGIIVAQRDQRGRITAPEVTNQGDSGAPLMLQDRRTFVGVLSGCAEVQCANHMDVYADLQ